MKKKLLALTLASAMAVSLVGCGGASEKETTSSAKETSETTAAAASEEKTEAAGEASVSEPEMVFKYAELNSDDNINTRVGYEFAKYVDEMSNGRIKIEVYSASTLGDEKTCLNALQMGGGYC